MNPQTYGEHIEQHRKLARTTLALDEELGAHHGIAWTDLLLLDLLQAEGGHIAMVRAATCQGLTPARLLRQVLPMEKLGLVQRLRDPQGARALALAPAGKRVLKEASYTAEAVLGLGH